MLSFIDEKLAVICKVRIKKAFDHSFKVIYTKYSKHCSYTVAHTIDYALVQLVTIDYKPAYNSHNCYI